MSASPQQPHAQPQSQNPIPPGFAFLISVDFLNSTIPPIFIQASPIFVVPTASATSNAQHVSSQPTCSASASTSQAPSLPLPPSPPTTQPQPQPHTQPNSQPNAQASGETQSQPSTSPNPQAIPLFYFQFFVSAPQLNTDNQSPQELLNRLFQQHQPRGPPPASQKVVDSLPSMEVTSDRKPGDDCSICQDCFEPGQRALELPCHHYFHPECITPWLKEHNTCPTCRYELETEDPEYEKSRVERMRKRARMSCPCGLAQVRECAVENETLVTLVCGHKFHEECVGVWNRIHGFVDKIYCPTCSHAQPRT